MVKRVKRVEYGPCRRVLRPQAGGFSQNRKKAAQQPKGSGLRWTAFLMMSLLVMLSSMFTYTYSYFQDMAVNSGNYFKATDIGKFLEVYPGKAKACFPSVEEPNGQNPPVAIYNGEGLGLDFGEIPEGNSANFENILWFRNITGNGHNVSWHLEGEIQPLVDPSQGSFHLLADAGSKQVSNNENLSAAVYESNLQVQPASEDKVNQSAYSFVYTPIIAEAFSRPQPASKDTVDQSAYDYAYAPAKADAFSQADQSRECSSPYSFSLKLSANSAPGLYQGLLVINVDGEFLALKIPARVMVREKINPKEMLQPTTSKSVYESGSGSLTPAPVQGIEDSADEKSSPQPETVTPETPGEAPLNETPSETPGQSPGETPGQTPSEIPGQTPSETPSEAPSKAPNATPSETPGEAPSETPSEAPSKAPNATPSETPGEAPSETPADTPADTPSENSSGNNEIIETDEAENGGDETDSADPAKEEAAADNELIPDLDIDLGGLLQEAVDIITDIKDFIKDGIGL